jgi:hypothetical protein
MAASGLTWESIGSTIKGDESILIFSLNFFAVRPINIMSGSGKGWPLDTFSADGAADVTVACRLVAPPRMAAWRDRQTQIRCSSRSAEAVLDFG